NKVKAMVMEAKKDPFARDYNDLYSNMSQEDFRAQIDILYQKNIKEERYPVMIAFNSLTYLQSQMDDAATLTQRAKGDAIRDGLQSKHTSAEDHRLGCADNIRQAIARIVAYD